MHTNDVWHDGGGATPSVHRELADRYGTPLFVYEGVAIRQAIPDLVAKIHPSVEILYPVRTNPNLSVIGLIAGYGAATVVSSTVELRSALLAGVHPHDIVFLRPGKSTEELRECVAARIYAVVVESFRELAELDRVAAAAGAKQRVLLRINPRSSEKDHPGAFRARFGVDEAEALGAGPLPEKYPALDIAGMHLHLGAGLVGWDVPQEATRQLTLATRIAAATSTRLDAVNLTGGLDLTDADDGTDATVAQVPARLRRVVEEFRSRHPHTRLLFEAGEYLAARGGSYVVQVRHVTEPTGQRLALLDGYPPIGDRYRRHGAVRLLNRPDDGPAGEYRLAGPLDTFGDVVPASASLPPLREGDLLSFERCIGPAATAAPGRPLIQSLAAEVLIHSDETHLIRDRDQPLELLSKQRRHPLVGIPIDRAQIIEQIRVAAARLLGHEVPALQEDTKLGELGVDRIGELEILIHLEQLWPFEVDADDLGRDILATIGSLVDYIEQQTSQRSPRTGGASHAQRDGLT